MACVEMGEVALCGGLAERRESGPEGNRPPGAEPSEAAPADSRRTELIRGAAAVQGDLEHRAFIHPEGAPEGASSTPPKRTDKGIGRGSNSSSCKEKPSGVSACRSDTGSARTDTGAILGSRRRRRSDAKATTYQHPGVGYRLLRASADESRNTYTASPPTEVLDRMAETGELQIELEDGSLWLGEVQQYETGYHVKFGKLFYAKVEDPRLMAKAIEEGRRKPNGNRPVMFEAKGSAWTFGGERGVRAVRDAFEAALWGDKTPPRLPAMWHVAMDVEVGGRERDVGRFETSLFAAPGKIRDSWCRRSVKDSVLEYAMTNGSSNRGSCRQLNLGSSSLMKLAIYEKSQEITRKSPEYREAVYRDWKAAGWDGHRKVIRVEVRVTQGWLHKNRLPDGRFFDQLVGDDFEAELESIFKAALDRNRFCPGKGNRKRRPEHPFWSFLRECLPMLRSEERWSKEPSDVIREDRERQVVKMARELAKKAAALGTWVDREPSEVLGLAEDVVEAEPETMGGYVKANGYARLAEERWFRDQLGHPSVTQQWLVMREEVNRGLEATGGA